MKIGFFDSGIGGMTVLQRALRLMPQEDYVYYADTSHVPYGEKTTDEVRKFVFEAIDFIAGKDVKAIVVACNTATSVAVKDLRQKYQFPIIGIEPAVKPAIRLSQEQGKRVMVFATALTLKEKKFHHLVEGLDEQHLVDGMPMPRLVEFAEKFEFRPDVVKEYLAKQLTGYDLTQYGTVVLGCTHFPIYRDVIQNFFPSQVEILDGGIGTAQNLQRILTEKQQTGGGCGAIEYYHSGEKVTDAATLAQYADLLTHLREIPE